MKGNHLRLWNENQAGIFVKAVHQQMTHEKIFLPLEDNLREECRQPVITFSTLTFSIISAITLQAGLQDELKAAHWQLQET